MTVPAFNATELAATTGLSVSQIARLFGVERRTVNDWSLFGAVPTAHEDRYQRILTVIARFQPAKPEEIRARLLTSQAGGSVFHRLLAELPEPQTLQVAGVSVRDRIAL